MTSRGHVIGGLSVFAAVCRVAVGSPMLSIRPFADMAQFVHINLGMWPIAVALYLFGTLLPDCDVETSALGRYVHIKLGHRTWTHSLWAPLVLLAVGYGYFRQSWMLWVVFGYLVHLVIDSWSKMGICWFYPYPGFIEYSSGARVKRGRAHKMFVLYRTGSSSETAVCAGLIVMCVFVWALPYLARCV